MPTKINTEALERIRAKLNDLPPKPKDAYSGREAITELEAAIRHAQSLDYDIAEIATMLTENGLHLSASTMSSYLRELEPKPESKKKPAKRKRAGSSAKPDLDPVPAPAAISPQDKHEPFPALDPTGQDEIELDQLLETLSKA